MWEKEYFQFLKLKSKLPDWTAGVSSGIRGILKAWTVSPAGPWKSPGMLLFSATSAFPSAEEMRPLPQREVVWLVTQFVFCSKAALRIADLRNKRDKSIKLPPLSWSVWWAELQQLNSCSDVSSFTEHCWRFQGEIFFHGRQNSLWFLLELYFRLTIWWCTQLWQKTGQPIQTHLQKHSSTCTFQQRDWVKLSSTDFAEISLNITVLELGDKLGRSCWVRITFGAVCPSSALPSPHTLGVRQWVLSQWNCPWSQSLAVFVWQDAP